MLFICSNFVLLQIPKADYSEAVKTHIYNRIHDAEWSNKLYGHFRYGFLGRLSTTHWKGFLDDALRYKYITNNMYSPSYYKNNLASGFIVHRVYIYIAIILIEFNGLLNTQATNLSMLTIAATVIPAIGCYFRPFQGYGASEAYIWSNLPLAFITGCYTTKIILDNDIIGLTTGQKIILIAITVDITAMILTGLIAKLKTANELKINLSESSFLNGFYPDCRISKDVASVIKFVEGISMLIDSHESKINTTSIMCNEMHTQSLAEVIVGYANRLKLNKFKAKLAFTPIDNYNYGSSKTMWHLQ